MDRFAICFQQLKFVNGGLPLPTQGELLPGHGKGPLADQVEEKGTDEFLPAEAPLAVNNWLFLAREGFYDGLLFHRVDPGFVIQGGDPEGTGAGGPGYNLPAEFNADNPVPHRVGTLAMARRGDSVDSAGSQFYIVLEDSSAASALNGQYTVFGHVYEGMDVVRAVEKDDEILSVTIEEKPIAERVVGPDDIRAGNLPAGVAEAAEEAAE